MNALDYTCIGIAIIALLVAAIVSFLCRQRTRRMFENVGNMLDRGIDGSFVEGVFDESALSAVEGKFARYLSLCAVSSKNLLAEKNKIKELISHISHQTKTPIANILLYSQLLSEYKLPQEGTLCVNTLSSQAEKLNFLINTLIKISQLETGIITVLPQQEPVQRMLDGVREQIMSKAAQKDICVTMEATEIRAWFDLKWTTEAIYNIVDNAVKYTNKGGHIVIKALSYELFCRIDITDNGIGIAENEQSKIFTRFYRSAIVANQEGVGLGLFLAREIVAAQGGYIKVFSEPDRGSTFSVFLPGIK